MGERSPVERIKAESAGLRGSLARELEEPAGRFSADGVQLLKFHGIYQQDDRDRRKAADGAERTYSFMIRTKTPGGVVPGAFFLALGELADAFGNGTLRVTTRQAFQLHGVAKADLRETIATIVRHLGSTLGACGDVNRNVLAPALPFAGKAYAIARETAHAVADLLMPRTGAYYEIWRDGGVAFTSADEADPLYGDAYLPRKFKVAVAVAGDNSVDILANDLGIVPVLSATDALLGYDLYVGGGLGATHRKRDTFPRLGEPLGFCESADLLGFVRAIVAVQRDYGDRTNRRHARLKYTIADRGLAWFRIEVERYAERSLAAFRALPPWRHRDYLGWHEQGDGKLALGIPVRSGRIADTDDRRLRSMLREVVETHGRDLVLTPQQNVLVVDVPRSARAAIDATARAHGIPSVETIAPVERHALACPALPTCGLALTEAERALPTVVRALGTRLAELGLGDEPIGVRMTGCPNGCARPYLGEIGLVGVSGDRYNVSLGGSVDSVRLNRPFRELVPLDGVVAALDGPLVAFARDRLAGESFGDFCARTLPDVPEPAATR